jgi:hypothetical protein
MPPAEIGFVLHAARPEHSEAMPLGAGIDNPARYLEIGFVLPAPLSITIYSVLPAGKFALPVPPAKLALFCAQGRLGLHLLIPCSLLPAPRCLRPPNWLCFGAPAGAWER